MTNQRTYERSDGQSQPLINIRSHVEVVTYPHFEPEVLLVLHELISLFVLGGDLGFQTLDFFLHIVDISLQSQRFLLRTTEH